MKSIIEVIIAFVLIFMVSLGQVIQKNDNQRHFEPCPSDEEIEIDDLECSWLRWP